MMCVLVVVVVLVFVVLGWQLWWFNSVSYIIEMQCVVLKSKVQELMKKNSQFISLFILIEINNWEQVWFYVEVEQISVLLR